MDNLCVYLFKRVIEDIEDEEKNIWHAILNNNKQIK